jgi:histidyl-tRNA synthetase
VNSLGDRDSKQRYRDALVKFLSPNESKLSEDSQRRLRDNPLRILDSKDPRDIEAVQGAPPASEHLSDKSRGHFDRVCELLKKSEVPFSVDGTLVRGFDYYSDTLWEVTAGGLGAQNALGGGGRYDNLVEMLGGKSTPGVGFGSGLERLLIALEGQGIELPRPTQPLVWLIAHGDAARDANLQLLNELRAAGIAADMDLGNRAVKSQFKLAEREGATISIVTGDDELAARKVQLKVLATREQIEVPRDRVATELHARLAL